MPILPGGSGPVAAGQTTKVSDIITAVDNDLMQELAPEHPVLIPYVNRVCQTILRRSRWAFVLSAPARFITKEGQSDYWVGATGNQPTGVVDTGLNLTDVEFIKAGTVFDRTNNRSLMRVSDAPLSTALESPDALSRPSRPAIWRFGPDQPNVMSVYPAADNQNTYQPIPEAPLCTTIAGGSLPARTYYVGLTFVDSFSGESILGNTVKISIPASYLLVVNSPQVGFNYSASGVAYSQYRVYAGTINSLTLQSTSTNIGNNWTELTSGLVAGATPPQTSTIATLDGYIIEFRYFKSRLVYSLTTQIIQIPDDYKDIVVAGVNWYCAKYLKKDPEAILWKSEFERGMLEMVRDKNIFPKGQEFMRPDSGSGNSNNNLYIVDSFQVNG